MAVNKALVQFKNPLGVLTDGKSPSLRAGESLVASLLVKQREKTVIFPSFAFLFYSAPQQSILQMALFSTQSTDLKASNLIEWLSQCS